jgi:cytochrome c oxidase subunit II
MSRSPSPLDPHGHDAGVLSQEIIFQIVAGSAVLLLVLGVLAAIVVRHRRRTALVPAETDDEDGIRWIWFGGLALPLVVLTAVVGWTVRSVIALGDEPAPARTIQVIAHRWWWEVRYPGERIATANEMAIPVGQTVRLRLQTADVIHSFWVPQLDRKADMVPGRISKLELTADRPGTYLGECQEYCGLQHARMRFEVEAMAPGDFQAWLRRERSAAPPPDNVTEREGLRTFLDRGCANCHTISGTPALGQVGPDLTHLASRPTIAAATLANTRGRLAAWISDPQHVKRGALMPRLDLSGPELQRLLDYLESLK